jgi:hypothetical protein
VKAVMTLTNEPPFASTDQTPHSLVGVDKLLTEFTTNAKLAKLSKTLAPEYRELFKRLRSVVDGPFAKLRTTYRLSEEDAPNLLLLPNPLDAPEVALAFRTPEGSHAVVFGLPANDGDPDLKPALKAYSALLAQELSTSVAAAGIDDALAQLKVRDSLAADVSAETVIRESLKMAVESKLWSKTATRDAEAAFHHGLLYAPEFLKALDEPVESFPTVKGSFVAQVVARVDLKKALVDSEKGQPAEK